MGLKRRTRNNPLASYIAAAPTERQPDLVALDRLIRKTVPQLEPTLAFGMMSYGAFHYRYATGREGDAAKISLAHTKGGFSLYCLASDSKGYLAEQFVKRLPKANIGKSCVRFKRLSDLDQAALCALLRKSASAGWS